MSAGWMRVVGLVLAVGLSGAPAALAACAAACLPGMGHLAPVMPAAPAAGDPGVGPPGHHHHAPATPAATPARGSSSVAASASLHPCCPDPQTLTAFSAAVLRADAPGVPAAVTTRVGWRQALPSPSVSRTARPPAAASARARTPLVLRI